MKYLSSSGLILLIGTVLFSSLASGFNVALPFRPAFSTPASHGVRVWFDYPYFLESGPCEYQLVVHAQTWTGLWITSLHWDYGDGSTLDVRVRGGNLITDSEVHGYGAAKTYIVTVTAVDSAGTAGTASWGISSAFPTSCVRAPGIAKRGAAQVISSVVFPFGARHRFAV